LPKKVKGSWGFIFEPKDRVARICLPRKGSIFYSKVKVLPSLLVKLLGLKSLFKAYYLEAIEVMLSIL
jgi:hypothetical protein